MSKNNVVKGITPKVEGAFVTSLKRNNSKIKADRAEAIEEDAEVFYGRTVQDIRLRLKKMRRDRENMLDMSPENSMSLIVASNFDAQAYVDADLKLGVDVRNLEIKLEVAEDRYSYLFGGTA